MATIVLTDGAQRANPPRDGDPIIAARRAKDLGYPIHTVVFGSIESQGQLRDAAIEKLIANQTVFVKNELTVTGQVRLSGYVNQNVPVQLLFETAPGKMEVVATTQARATSDGELVPVELVYAPQVPGEHKLTLRIPPREGELVTSNNEDTTYVTVLKGGLRVLYLTGLVRDEQTFILRALRASRDIKVDYFRLNARRPNQRSDRVNQALTEGLAPGKFDVYILGDLDAEAFLPGELERLRDTVNRGAGLIMLGGSHSFGPGGYADTPLADVLPVKMSPLERQRFGEPVRDNVHINSPLKMRPGPLAGRQFVTLLAAPERNAQLWQSLPPLDGANKFRGVKEAPVWLEGPNTEPLLVAGNSAAGRVLAFAGDTTWRWVMHGFGDAHKRFWRQVVLWLAKKDQTNEGRVWIDLDERRVRFGARVNFTTGAQDAQGEPLNDAEFEGDIVLPGGKRETLKLNRQGQQATGSFKQTQTPGEYTITVRANHQGKSLGSATARFLVFKQELELERPAADLSAMRRLSSMTPGGEAITPEAFPALLEKLKLAPRELEVEELTKTTLWDKWLVCLVLGVLLTAEWYFRKKWGLV